jgi:molecular chaperone HtpG
METLTFNAETSRLLDLVIHSLYTRPEIFLRELVSNASDALDRFRFEAMLNPALGDDAPLEIRLEVDVAARTLTIRDNGIGMSRDEVIAHIGTIARSGTKEFEAQLSAQPSPAEALDLIGRFGVGFYSSFMVADQVTIETRRAGEVAGTRWQSQGGVHYTLEDTGAIPRGTAVTLRLKPIDADMGIEDYTDQWILTRIIKRYADFVTYPIVYVGPPAAGATDSSDSTDVASVRAVLNSMKPIWRRPQNEVKPEEYHEFYKHISHDWNEPLLRLSFKAEGRWEYAALVFVPSQAPYDLYYHAASFGLQLYSQRVLIMENCQELLPRYLRFVKGVVDAADLPLNVSRQVLQQAHHLTAIRKWLTKKIVDQLDTLRKTDETKYTTLWQQFGRALKEGISEDYDNKDRLTPLLLFPSSADESRLTTLADYVSRMKPDQKDIFYLSGESRALVERSPHLEELRARGYEVLYFTEPVDELVAQSMHEFDGRRLRSAAKSQMALGDDEERTRRETEVAAQSERLSGLLTFMAKHLESRVRTVRVSNRLTTSPACLASEETDMSPHIERLLRGKETTHRRILELNASHPAVIGLHETVARHGEGPMAAAAADLLFGIALLSEGSQLPDVPAFTSAVTDLLARALESREGS